MYFAKSIHTRARECRAREQKKKKKQTEDKNRANISGKQLLYVFFFFFVSVERRPLTIPRTVLLWEPSGAVNGPSLMSYTSRYTHTFVHSYNVSHIVQGEMAVGAVRGLVLIRRVCSSRRRARITNPYRGVCACTIVNTNNQRARDSRIPLDPKLPVAVPSDTIGNPFVLSRSFAHAHTRTLVPYSPTCFSSSVFTLYPTRSRAARDFYESVSNSRSRFIFISYSIHTVHV